MDKLNKIVSYIALGGVLLLGLAYFTTPSSSPGGPTAQEVADNISQRLGALVGPDIPFPYISVGGVKTYRARAPLNQASTTICALKAPNATSTLRYAGLLITTGTTTATAIDIGRSTLPNATTSLLRATYSATSLETPFIFTGGATTTDSALSNIDFTFGSGTSTKSGYVVFKYGGAGGTLTGANKANDNTFVGSCEAEWLVF